MELLKTCGRCKKTLPSHNFYKKENGLESFCKPCKLDYNKKYLKNIPYNPEKAKKYFKKHVEYTRKRRLAIKEKYGLGAGTVSRFGFKLALAVYDRDERKCKHCGETNDLTIHHKDRQGRNFENMGLKPNNDMNNLIVLCRKCHGRIHGKQGGRPFRRENAVITE